MSKTYVLTNIAYKPRGRRYRYHHLWRKRAEMLRYGSEGHITNGRSLFVADKFMEKYFAVLKQDQDLCMLEVFHIPEGERKQRIMLTTIGGLPHRDGVEPEIKVDVGVMEVTVAAGADGVFGTPDDVVTIEGPNKGLELVDEPPAAEVVAEVTADLAESLGVSEVELARAIAEDLVEVPSVEEDPEEEPVEEPVVVEEEAVVEEDPSKTDIAKANKAQLEAWCIEYEVELKGRVTNDKMQKALTKKLHPEED